MKMSPFPTSDLWLAAYCLAKGYRLAHVDKTNPRAQFVFSDVPRIAIEDYWNNKPVPVMDYVRALQDLKRRLYSDT